MKNLQGYKEFTTQSLHPRDRFSYWQDVICQVFLRLNANQVGRAPFHGYISSTPFDQFHLARVSADAQWVKRTRREIAADSSASILSICQLDGTCIIRQAGRESHLMPGDIAVFDSERPYDLIFDDRFNQLVLQVPKSSFIERCSFVESLTARTIDQRTPLGRMTFSFLCSLAKEATLFDRDTKKRLSHQALDLLVTTLNASVGEHRSEGTNIQLHHLARAKSFIDSNLSNPELNVRMIAQACGISDRYLRKIFEIEGISISRWIRDQRLAHCKRDLKDPLLRHLSTADIAYKWGFSEASHFSRAYKKKFGVSPRVTRSAAITKH